MIIFAACSFQTEKPGLSRIEVENTRQALSIAQARILGFESPSEDWSSSATISSSPIVSQGESALGVKPFKWAQLTSVPISTLSYVADTLRLDVQIPLVSDWGRIRVIIKLPSKGIWYQELGAQSLSGLSPGQYHTLAYPITSDLKAILEQSYNDLQIIISIESVPSFTPYLFDNIILTNDPEPRETDSDSGSGDTDTRENTGRLCEFSAYSSSGTDLRDRVHALNGMIGSASTVRLGASSRLDGDIEAVGEVFLASNAYVDGRVRSAGAIHEDPPTTVTGGIESYTSVIPMTIETKNVSYGTENVYVYRGQQISLVPGNYDEVHPYAGSELTFRSGTYNMRKLYVESTTVKINLDLTDGPVEINVQGELRFGDNMQVELIGESDPGLVNIYSNYTGQVKLGTDGSFFGTLTVPYGEIYAFSRMQINGALYGRQVIVDTDTTLTGLDCEVPPSNGLRPGADTMTQTASIWWSDYRPGEIVTTDGLRFNIENVISKNYTAIVKIRYLGPLGSKWQVTLEESVLTPGESASFDITARGLGMHSETSAMQAQPEITLIRLEDNGSVSEEKRLVPPIYYRHKPGTGFMQIEIFDEATLIAERKGKLAWGSEVSVSPGDLLGYRATVETMEPVYAGQGESAKIYNELGEVVGYKIGSYLGVNPQ